MFSRRYFEPFCVQDVRPGPGGMLVFADRCTIMETFVQGRSNTQPVAGAQDVHSGGKFAIDHVAVCEVRAGSVVRRVKDNAKFRITGHPVCSPAHARTQAAVYACEMIPVRDA